MHDLFPPGYAFGSGTGRFLIGEQSACELRRDRSLRSDRSRQAKCAAETQDVGGDSLALHLFMMRQVT